MSVSDSLNRRRFKKALRRLDKMKADAPFTEWMESFTAAYELAPDHVKKELEQLPEQLWGVEPAFRDENGYPYYSEEQLAEVSGKSLEEVREFSGTIPEQYTKPVELPQEDEPLIRADLIPHLVVHSAFDNDPDEEPAAVAKASKILDVVLALAIDRGYKDERVFMGHFRHPERNRDLDKPLIDALVEVVPWEEWLPGVQFVNVGEIKTD